MPVLYPIVFNSKRKKAIAVAAIRRGYPIRKFPRPFCILSSLFLGFLFIALGSKGSMLSAVAGSPSVTRFTRRIWVAVNGAGNLVPLPD